MTEPVTGSPGPSRLTQAHFAYSAWLFGLEPSRHVWAESPLFGEWLADLSQKGLSRVLPTLEWSLIWLEERLSRLVLSFGWAHRDFVPWNTRWVGGRLLLLDWEMARPHRPPAYDLLHFVSMQTALQGDPQGFLGRSFGFGWSSMRRNGLGWNGSFTPPTSWTRPYAMLGQDWKLPRWLKTGFSTGY